MSDDEEVIAKGEFRLHTKWNDDGTCSLEMHQVNYDHIHHMFQEKLADAIQMCLLEDREREH